MRKPDDWWVLEHQVLPNLYALKRVAVARLVEEHKRVVATTPVTGRVKSDDARWADVQTNLAALAAGLREIVVACLDDDAWDGSVAEGMAIVRATYVAVREQLDALDLDNGALVQTVQARDDEIAALKAQFTRDGIYVPYLDRMRELAARAEQAIEERAAVQEHVRLLNDTMRTYVEAASVFQIGGALYQEANLPLGGSTVVDGLAWIIDAYQQQKAALAEQAQEIARLQANLRLADAALNHYAGQDLDGYKAYLATLDVRR